MIVKKSLLLAAIITIIASSAEARQYRTKMVETQDNAMLAQEVSGQDATGYSSNDGQINYSDKNLANYQDPYLTNPRGYKSNQFGEAAPAPKANVFLSTQPY